MRFLPIIQFYSTGPTKLAESRKNVADILFFKMRPKIGGEHSNCYTTEPPTMAQGKSDSTWEVIWIHRDPAVFLK